MKVQIIESGQSLGNIHVLAAIAAALDLSVDDVISL